MKLFGIVWRGLWFVCLAYKLKYCFYVNNEPRATDSGVIKSSLKWLMSELLQSLSNQWIFCAMLMSSPEDNVTLISRDFASHKSACWSVILRCYKLHDNILEFMLKTSTISTLIYSSRLFVCCLWHITQVNSHDYLSQVTSRSYSCISIKCSSSL